MTKKNQILPDNPKKARKMGHAGRLHILKKFTWNKTSEAYEKFYSGPN